LVPILYAPMEGITDAVFRRVSHECFTGVEAYYIPFISPTKNLLLTGREKRNVMPEYNAGVPCVPQILTKEEEHFLWAARMMADLGYTEVNLNAGCPSGTVTAKGKGAGFLRESKMLDYFLEDVCAHSPIPVSVKTRIGFDSPEEWSELLRIYAQYPLKRLIIHPRTCRERYDPGTVHRECWAAACESGLTNLVFNGDLFTSEEAEAFLSAYPGTAGLMLGRGLVSNPALARMLQGGSAPTVPELVHFHDRLVQELSALYQPDIVFMKLRVVMKHIACCFDHAERIEKQIRKSRRLDELLAADRMLFTACPLKAVPAFVPDGLREF